MIYRYNIYLDIDLLDTNEHIIFKKFILNDNYFLIINIEFDNRSIDLNMNIHKYNEEQQATIDFSRKDYRFVCDMNKSDYNLFKICKTYKFKSEINDDVFMIKITSKDIKNQLDNNYNVVEVMNEINFTNFNNNIELIDLCALIMTRHVTTEIKDLFLQKLTYFGFKNFEEIVETNKIEDVVIVMIRTKTQKLIDLTTLVCDMATVTLNTDYQFVEKFLYRVNEEYEKISDIRVKYLRGNFII